MKKQLGLFLALAICVTTIFGGKISAFAADTSGLKNVIVSDDINSNSRVLSVADISGVWDISKDGKYECAGEAEGSTLYSNHYFKGKKYVEYRLENYSNSKLTVKIYKKGKPLFAVKTLTMKANGKGGGLIELDKNTEYYLKFVAPSDFYAYVK